jgi:hypothetical protein
MSHVAPVTLRLHLLALACSVAALSCADEAAPAPSTTNFEVVVSPLELDEIIQACYTVSVYNGPGGPGPANAPNQLIWTRQLCSLQFGNGPDGSISYVGPCDADTRINSVVLTVDRLDGAPLGSWENPCPADKPCIIEAPCLENRDVAITFNLVIMRQANQGFFDVAVDIRSVFCAAKFDTCYEAAEPGGEQTPILLLVAADGQRHHTGILAVSCTEGFVVTGRMHLYMTPIEIDCGDAYRISLDPTAGRGLIYEPPLSHESGEVWQYAIYTGIETQTCEGAEGLTQACPSLFWNVPIGIEGLPPGCRIRASFTPTPEPWPDGQAPANTSYPVIHLDTLLTDENGVICQQNPLNGDGSGVDIEYTDLLDEPIRFFAQLRRGDDGVEFQTFPPPEPDLEPAP